MKIHDLRHMNQDEAIVLRQRLALHASDLRARASAAGLQIAAPTISTAKGEELASIRILEMHCQEVELALNGEAPAFASPAPSHAPSASAQAAPASGVKKLSLTEQILAAKGCASLDELNSLHAGEVKAAVEDPRHPGEDTTPEDRQKQDDAKKTDAEMSRENLANIRNIALRLCPDKGESLTQFLIRCRGAKTLAELNQMYRDHQNAGKGDHGD